MARPRVTTAALVFLASVALRGEKSLQDVDLTLGYVLAQLGLSVALLVITTALLRLLVRRWVVRQPPDLPAP